MDAVEQEPITDEDLCRALLVLLRQDPRAGVFEAHRALTARFGRTRSTARVAAALGACRQVLTGE